MAKKYTYDYPRPAVTVDCVVLTWAQDGLQILLIQRDREPFAGSWALPGGFMEIDEPPDAAARRELEEETGLVVRLLQQLGTFGTVDRDPRGRVVTIAYYALVQQSRRRVQAASDARAAQWYDLQQLPSLAFDHAEILENARASLRNTLFHQPFGMELLPKKFTLRQLQRLYETILGRTLVSSRFRRKILRTGLLVDLNEMEAGVPRRATRLYCFDRARYKQLCEQGLNLEF